MWGELSVFAEESVCIRKKEVPYQNEYPSIAMSSEVHRLSRSSLGRTLYWMRKKYWVTQNAIAPRSANTATDKNEILKTE